MIGVMSEVGRSTLEMSFDVAVGDLVAREGGIRANDEAGVC